MKIIDCFTFYNEIDMLFYRLSVLYEHVDHFVIVEANQTYSGKEKISHFHENRKLFEPFMDKIEHIIVDLPFHFPNINYSNGEQWINERFQRDAIQLGLNRLHEKVGLNDQDLIVITDLDEIEDPELLKSCKKEQIIIPEKGACIPMDLYYYNLRSKHMDMWYFAKIITYKGLQETTPNTLRRKNIVDILPKKYGWHLSYFGDNHFIQNKIIHFSHQEYNHENYVNLDNIQNCINNTTDIYGRHYVPMIKIPLEENDYLPPQYESLLKKYM